MPETNIPEAELQTEREANDFSPEALIRRLNRITTILTRMNARLDIIRDRASPPPDPVKPQAIAAAQGVKAQAEEAVRIAVDIENKFNGR
jgi:hypothetical protein